VLCSLGIRGMQQANKADFPRLVIEGLIWQWDFFKPCPPIGGHPKGLGLGKITQVD
jgi:hypothetical protein